MNHNTNYPECQHIQFWQPWLSEVGGRLDKGSLVAIEAATVEAFHMLRADLCLLGICSLHPEVGISVPDMEEAYVKRAMIASAAEVAALASVEKLGTASTYTVGPLSDLTHLITEPDAPDELVAPYLALGITMRGKGGRIRG